MVADVFIDKFYSFSALNYIYITNIIRSLNFNILSYRLIDIYGIEATEVGNPYIGYIGLTVVLTRSDLILVLLSEKHIIT